MRVKIGVLCLLLVCGCAKQQTNYGSSTTVKVEGMVVSVQAVMPAPPGCAAHTITLTDRESADKLINALEALAADIKSARDQMPSPEPKEKK